LIEELIGKKTDKSVREEIPLMVALAVLGQRLLNSRDAAQTAVHLNGVSRLLELQKKLRYHPNIRLTMLSVMEIMKGRQSDG